MRSLGWKDTIIDGFYMAYGDFPEVCDKDRFPALDDLKKVRTAEGDAREVSVSCLPARHRYKPSHDLSGFEFNQVVYVDKDQDSSLSALKDRAAEAIEEAANKGSAAKIEVCSTGLILQILSIRESHACTVSIPRLSPGSSLITLEARLIARTPFRSSGRPLALQRRR